MFGGLMTDLSDVIESDSNKILIEETTSLKILKKKLSIIKTNQRELNGCYLYRIATKGFYQIQNPLDKLDF